MTIKEMRLKTHLSQAKFSHLLDIPVANITKWEQGVSSPPAYVETLIEYRLRSLRLLGPNDYRTNKEE